MPVLNPQILGEICLELLKHDDEGAPLQNLKKLAIAGKESYASFESCIASLKSVKIRGDYISVKFVSLFVFCRYIFN